MSNEMIERVAKALDASTMNSECHIQNCIECTENKDRVRIQAKAAIEAMKEPTQAMLDAGEPCVEQGSSLIGAWQAMIEAALKDG